MNAVSADHAQKANDAKADEANGERKTSSNNRAPADEGKIKARRSDSLQRYASCTNAGPGCQKHQIYFSNMKTRNALKFD